MYQVFMKLKFSSVPTLQVIHIPISVTFQDCFHRHTFRARDVRSLFVMCVTLVCMWPFFVKRLTTYTISAKDLCDSVGLCEPYLCQCHQVGKKFRFKTSVIHIHKI